MFLGSFRRILGFHGILRPPRGNQYVFCLFSAPEIEEAAAEIAEATAAPPGPKTSKAELLTHRIIDSKQRKFLFRPRNCRPNHDKKLTKPF